MTQAIQQTGRWLLGVTLGAIIATGVAPNLGLKIVSALGASAGIGAIGNAIDRVIYGAVADFFDFHVAGWHWPAFNIADAAITCGAVGLIIGAILPPRSRVLE